MVVGINGTRLPELPRTAIKKEARFKLRLFPREKKPSKLLTPQLRKKFR